MIVPVLNEAARLPALLSSLRSALYPGDELLVVDGGSCDDSMAIAEALADQVISSPPGRARQMNAGAAQAQGDWLWFVHADTGLDRRHRDALRQLQPGDHWARFDVRLSGRRLLFRVIAFMINLRSRLSGIATGDQALVVARQSFVAVGGFADQKLMEDIALSRALKRFRRARCLRPPLVTSSRRWQQHGPWRTIWLMWCLRFRYWRGASPDLLYREYYRREPGDG